MTESEPKIYTAGAFLVPMEVKMNGRKKKIWVAEEFEDDTFCDGKLITPEPISKNIKGLVSE